MEAEFPNLRKAKKEALGTIQGLARNKDLAPKTFEFQLTDKCDSGCKYCFNRNGPVNPFKLNRFFYVLAPEKVTSVMRELKGLGTKSISFSGGGEPLKLAGIEALINEAQGLFGDTRLVTNGYLLGTLKPETVRGIGELRVSIDSLDPRAYCEVRGVNQQYFERVYHNLSEACAERKGSHNQTGISIMVLPETLQSLEKTIKITRSLGVNFVGIKDDVIATSDVWQKAREYLLHLFRHYSRRDFEINIRPETGFMHKPCEYGCYVAYRKAAMDMHGNVFPCCLQAQPRYPAEYCLFNVFDFSSFRQAWEATREKRDQLSLGVNCQHCNFADILYNHAMAESLAQIPQQTRGAT